MARTSRNWPDAVRNTSIAGYNEFRAFELYWCELPMTSNRIKAQPVERFRWTTRYVCHSGCCVKSGGTTKSNNTSHATVDVDNKRRRRTCAALNEMSETHENVPFCAIPYFGINILLGLSGDVCPKFLPPKYSCISISPSAQCLTHQTMEKRSGAARFYIHIRMVEAHRSYSYRMEAIGSFLY